MSVNINEIKVALVCALQNWKIKGKSTVCDSSHRKQITLKRDSPKQRNNREMAGTEGLNFLLKTVFDLTKAPDKLS